MLLQPSPFVLLVVSLKEPEGTKVIVTMESRLGVLESCLHLRTLRNLSLVPRPQGWAAKSACSLFNAGWFSAVTELE